MNICACQAVNIVWDFQKCGIKRAIEQPRSWIVDKKQKVGNKQTRLTSDRPSQINCFHMTRRKFVKTRLKMEVFRIRGLRTSVLSTHCWAPVGWRIKSKFKLSIVSLHWLNVIAWKWDVCMFPLSVPRPGKLHRSSSACDAETDSHS